MSNRPSDCVFVLLPGFLDTAEHFVAHDFPRRIHRATGCDSIGVDANFRYYSESAMPEFLYRDVVFPAARRGYQTIWLLGNSMGGMAAMMVAAQHSRSIDGIVLMAPHVGYGPVLTAVTNAGSLAAWEPQNTTDNRLRTSWSDPNYTEHIWAWLKRYTANQGGAPSMFLAWGDSDEAREQYQIVASTLPAGRSAHTQGGHNWAAWTPLLETVLPQVRALIDEQRLARIQVDSPPNGARHD